MNGKDHDIDEFMIHLEAENVLRIRNNGRRIQLQQTFATKNCLVTLDKLHKTLVASVDEDNG